jgi:hypothetical protein
MAQKCRFSPQDVHEALLNEAWESLRKGGAVVTESFAPLAGAAGPGGSGAQAAARRKLPEPEPEPMWYTSSVHAAESAVASSLGSLLGWPPDASQEDSLASAASEVAALEAALGHVGNDSSRPDDASSRTDDGTHDDAEEAAELISLSDEQLAAVAAVVSPHGRGAIVTGGPGCGKTFIMKTGQKTVLFVHFVHLSVY